MAALQFFVSVTVLKKFMSPRYQALQNVLFWEVSEFLVERLQSYGSFKFKTFVWEIATKPH